MSKIDDICTAIETNVSWLKEAIKEDLQTFISENCVKSVSAYVEVYKDEYDVVRCSVTVENELDERLTRKLSNRYDEIDYLELINDNIVVYYDPGKGFS